jgi:hypothetical protein
MIKKVVATEGRELCVGIGKFSEKTWEAVSRSLTVGV